MLGAVRWLCDSVSTLQYMFVPWCGSGILIEVAHGLRQWWGYCPLSARPRSSPRQEIQISKNSDDQMLRSVHSNESRLEEWCKLRSGRGRDSLNDCPFFSRLPHFQSRFRPDSRRHYDLGSEPCTIAEALAIFSSGDLSRMHDYGYGCDQLNGACFRSFNSRFAIFLIRKQTGRAHRGYGSRHGILNSKHSL